MLYDTVLSEYAALGFEYGYSVADPDALGRLGGAVRRLHQRRADHHRPVHRRRRGQVGPAAQPRAAPPPRLRGPGARALQRAHRAVPRAVRREQPAGLLPDDRGAVLPRAAPADPAPSRKPLVCFTPKRYLRMPPDALAGRRRSRTARSTRSSTTARLTVDAGDGAARAALHRQDRARAHGPARPARRARSRSCGSSSSTRGPRASSSTLAAKYPECDQVWWVQEEPANMGAWNYVHGKLHRILRDRAQLRHIARPPSPSARRAGAPRSTTASRSSCSSTRSPIWADVGGQPRGCGRPARRGTSRPSADRSRTRRVKIAPKSMSAIIARIGVRRRAHRASMPWRISS